MDYICKLSNPSNSLGYLDGSVYMTVYYDTSEATLHIQISKDLTYWDYCTVNVTRTDNGGSHSFTLPEDPYDYYCPLIDFQMGCGGEQTYTFNYNGYYNDGIVREDREDSFKVVISNDLTYKVYYYSMDVSKPVVTETYTAGTIQQIDTSEPESIDGHYFNGYKTSSDTDVIAYPSNGETYTVTMLKDIRLYASYSKYCYRPVYYGNGGCINTDYGTDTAYPHPSEKLYGEGFKLELNKFNRRGHKFIGWIISRPSRKKWLCVDSSGNYVWGLESNAKLFEDCGTVPDSAMLLNDLYDYEEFDIKAQWERVVPKSYVFDGTKFKEVVSIKMFDGTSFKDIVDAKHF